MKSVVFFDFDGVLADFVSGALAVHHSDLRHDEVVWDIVGQLGFASKPDEFWRPMKAPAFWAGLQPLPDGMALWRRVVRAVGVDNVGILSSAGLPGAVEGKREWLARHLPGCPRCNVCFLTNKSLAAGPGKVLVDDYEGNTDTFAAAGGTAVLVPRPWNRRRDEEANLYAEVMKAVGVSMRPPCWRADRVLPHCLH